MSPIELFWTAKNTESESLSPSIDLFACLHIVCHRIHRNRFISPFLTPFDHFQISRTAVLSLAQSVGAKFCNYEIVGQVKVA